MKKILIIDDVEMGLDAIAGIIGDEIECTIMKSTNGRDGLEKFRIFQPDVIITDTEMPGMNGVQVIRAIRKECSDAKIILKSASKENKVLADQEGVEFYWFEDYESIIELLK